MKTAMVGVLAAAGVAACTGCGGSPKTVNEVAALEATSEVAFDDFEKQFPGIRARAEAAYAYAIFPRVTKGAFVVGGARGTGVVYERGAVIGTVVLSEASVGAQVGGTGFRELILFEDERALRQLTTDALDFSGQASAAAGTAAGTAKTDFDDGVAVYVVGVGGLILDASVAGQKFVFTPLQ